MTQAFSTLLLTFLSLLAGAFISYRVGKSLKSLKSLAYYIDADYVFYLSDNENNSKIRASYSGMEVSHLIRAELKIWNPSEVPIGRADVSSVEPIEILLEDGQIIDFNNLRSSHGRVAPSGKLSERGLLLEFEMLNEYDYLEVTLYSKFDNSRHSYLKKESFVLRGAISGISDEFMRLDKYNSYKIPFSPKVSIFLALTLFFIFLSSPLFLFYLGLIYTNFFKTIDFVGFSFIGCSIFILYLIVRLFRGYYRHVAHDLRLRRFQLPSKEKK
ncbi:MAG: hypothetical protein ABGX08_03800 [Citromicrobium sp.]